MVYLKWGLPFPTDPLRVTPNSIKVGLSGRGSCACVRFWFPAQDIAGYVFQELELFKAIKGVSKRVVAVTGQQLDEVETQQLIEMGFYAVFPKSFDARALTQALGLSEKPTVSPFEGMVA